MNPYRRIFSPTPREPSARPHSLDRSVPFTCLYSEVPRSGLSPAVDLCLRRAQSSWQSPRSPLPSDLHTMQQRVRCLEEGQRVLWDMLRQKGCVGKQGSGANTRSTAVAVQTDALFVDSLHTLGGDTSSDLCRSSETSSVSYVEIIANPTRESQSLEAATPSPRRGSTLRFTTLCI